MLGAPPRQNHKHASSPAITPPVSYLHVFISIQTLVPSQTSIMEISCKQILIKVVYLSKGNSHFKKVLKDKKKFFFK